MQNNRIYLHVPYNEKDKAKSLGAWWDKNYNDWYITDKHDKDLFTTWLPKISHDINITHKSRYFYLAKTHRYCFRCEKETSIYAIIVNLQI